MLHNMNIVIITQDNVTENLMRELVNLNKNPACDFRVGNAWSAGSGLTYDLQHPDFAAKCFVPARTYIKAEPTHLKLVFTCLDRRHNRKLNYKNYSDHADLALDVYNLIPKVLHAHIKDFSVVRGIEERRRKKISWSKSTFHKLHGEYENGKVIGTF